MKVTFDLPPDLVRELKLRAVLEGRKLKEVAAAVVRSGLSAETERSKGGEKPSPAKFPLFQCSQDAPASKMGAEQLIALEQAVLDQEGADDYAASF